MALLSDYTAGTVTIAANGTAVSGSGTAWLAAGFAEGDVLIANGYFGLVGSVQSNTALTLAQPWRGGALNGAGYRLRYQGDGSRISAQARALVELLGGSGNLEALGKLTAGANQLPYFTGAGQMALTGLTPFARTLLDDADQATARQTLGAQAALGFTPIQQGGTADSGTNKIYVGWGSDASLRLRIDNTEFGSTWPIKARDNVAKTGDTMTGSLTVNGDVSTRSNVRVGVGQQSSMLEMHDTDEGNRYLHNNGGAIGFLGSTVNWIFRVGDNGVAVAAGEVHAGNAILGTDGNVYGSVWNNWGAADAFTAISTRIDNRIASLISGSLAASGYTKLQNGLIIQWGSGVITNGNVGIVFPIAFPNAAYAVVPVSSGPTADNATLYSVAADGLTQTGVNLRGRGTLGGGVFAAGLNYNYIAIGR
ncbi:gp53-like domain-containing protein [Rhizobium oryziradicis]|uniref:Putative tail fiber protein gp53-like C-terminal domain-containing protein n=1 Tax=Rhizobium oryziradicis TaxID=1867956 RepID=A0A1Q8ZRX3_9HYPH|nr:hypothetical protein [Rhizobium oryziradicis]OLP44748.1 hypothetical protein BJF95_09730 [Rhizobium oryziradicis]